MCQLNISSSGQTKHNGREIRNSPNSFSKTHHEQPEWARSKAEITLGSRNSSNILDRLDGAPVSISSLPPENDGYLL